MNSRTALLAVFRSRRMALLAALGFTSGLPLYLTSLLLAARLADSGIEIKAIAAFSLVGLAYSLKWVWAPLIDRWSMPWLGRRRGWMAVFQLGLALSVAALAVLDPNRDLATFAATAILIAIFSASLDVVIDGYRADVLEPHERAAGAAVYVMGYRAAMVATGTLALGLVDCLGWRMITLILAGMTAISILVTLASDEPPAPAVPRNLRESIILPWRALLTRRRAGVILAFVALYKLGDHLTLAVVVAFLKLNFGNAAVAAVYKGVGFAGVMLGGLVAGPLVTRMGARRSLILFGALQAAANLAYAALALAGKSYGVFAAAVLLDEAANSMGTAAFMAFLMGLCDRRVSATQYALLTSLSSVGQRAFGWIAGPIVSEAGWVGFFVTTALIAIPGLVVVRWLPEHHDVGQPDRAT